jgi:hypothetical protein
MWKYLSTNYNLRKYLTTAQKKLKRHGKFTHKESENVREYQPTKGKKIFKMCINKLCSIKSKQNWKHAEISNEKEKM